MMVERRKMLLEGKRQVAGWTRGGQFISVTPERGGEEGGGWNSKRLVMGGVSQMGGWVCVDGQPQRDVGTGIPDPQGMGGGDFHSPK